LHTLQRLVKIQLPPLIRIQFQQFRQRFSIALDLAPLFSELFNCLFQLCVQLCVRPPHPKGLGILRAARPHARFYGIQKSSSLRCPDPNDAMPGTTEAMPSVPLEGLLKPTLPSPKPRSWGIRADSSPCEYV